MLQVFVLGLRGTWATTAYSTDSRCLLVSRDSRMLRPLDAASTLASGSHRRRIIRLTASDVTRIEKMLELLLSPGAYRSLSTADRACATATVAPFLSASAAASSALGRLPSRRDRHSDTFEALSDGVATFTLEGVLLDRNPTLAELLGDTGGAPALLDAMGAVVVALRELHESPGETSGGGRAAVTGKAHVDGETIHIRACLLTEYSGDVKPVALVVVTRPHRPLAFGDAGKRARAQYKLTEREMQVAMLLAKRRSNCEIAAGLGLSEHTVRHHTERILRKMGAASRTEVASLVRSSKTAPRDRRPAR